MKRGIFLMSIVLIPIVLAGCGPSTGVTRPEEVAFQIVQLENLQNDKAVLPDNNTAINLLSKSGGKFHFSDGNDLILFIGLGQRKTAGYNIKVKSIKTYNNGAAYDVIIEEIKPAKGDIVVQVITYPYVLVNLGHVSSPKEITVKDEEGKYLNNLSYYLNPPRVEVSGP